MNNLETVIDRATEVLGSDDKAKDWIEKMSNTLGDKPMNLLKTNEGIVRVLCHLNSIERASFSDL